MIKSLILGLDGATWDIIKPLAEEDKLPTFKKLMEKGVWGNLASTIPPVTGPTWVSFATGRKPGKHEVIDFLNRKKDSYKLKSVNSSDFFGKSVGLC